MADSETSFMQAAYRGSGPAARPPADGKTEYYTPGIVAYNAIGLSGTISDSEDIV
jgi:hypothetical protein